MHTALVIGATGLVGRAAVAQLLEDASYDKVIAFTRRPTGVKHAKYEEQVVDFGKPETFAAQLKGDALFSALGTTRGQVGSVEAQRVVDYTYQLETAKAAATNGVKAYALCSASSANAKSWLAYSKMKGELERDVLQLGFSTAAILRPGLLVGEREKPRGGERMAEAVLGAFNAVGVLRSQRPISGATVARAMINGVKKPGTTIYEAAEVFTLAEAR